MAGASNMSNNCVILTLAAPMQSWGTQALGAIRPTSTYPTRSGIVGMLSAALGLNKNEEGLKSLLDLDQAFNMAVRADVVNNLEYIDYHTIRESRAVIGIKPIMVTKRHYLVSCAFTVALLFKEDSANIWMDKVIEALAQPKASLFLGRASCLHAPGLLRAVGYAGNLHDALEKNPALNIVKKYMGRPQSSVFGMQDSLCIWSEQKPPEQLLFIKEEIRDVRTTTADKYSKRTVYKYWAPVGKE